jgi:hypothetical protein
MIDWRTNPRDQPEWMRHVRVGDVLLTGRGTYRVVRAVTYRADGALTAVQFVIRRRSWTRRVLTTVIFSDMVTLGYQPTHIRDKLNRPIDRAIEQETRNTGEPVLTYADVRGLA